MAEDIFSAEVAAQKLDITKKTLFKYCKERRINFYKLPGGDFKFRQNAIDLFLAQHFVEATNNTPMQFRRKKTPPKTRLSRAA